MKAFFATVAVLAFAYGVLIMLNAKSAVHEIETFLLFLIALISAGFSSMHSQSDNNQKKLDEQLDDKLSTIIRSLNGEDAPEPKPVDPNEHLRIG